MGKGMRLLDELDAKIARMRPWLYAALIGAVAVLVWAAAVLRDLI
jgi:hypothetical protein